MSYNTYIIYENYTGIIKNSQFLSKSGWLVDGVPPPAQHDIGYMEKVI